MNKKKLLLENFAVYGLGQILYKIVPLIMLPILTKIIPDSSYYLGINDLASTIVSLVAAIGLMGLYDAVFRLVYDYDEDNWKEKQSICSTAIILTFGMSCVCMMILAIFSRYLSRQILKAEELYYLIIICGVNVILTNLENMLLTPTRMLNDRKRYVIGNILIAVSAYVVAIALVSKGYFVIALPLGMALSLLIGCIFFGIGNHKWFSLRAFDKLKVIPLLKIGIPLFPTFIILWVFSSFDKLMITNMLDVRANGVFAVTGKLAQVSQLVTSAFSTGWSYFAMATMKDIDRTKVFSKIIDYILGIGVCLFLLCRIFGTWLMRILFSNEYSSAGVVFAYLFLAPIINMIFQMMGTQFLLIKKTYFTTIIAGIGVLLNIGMNYVWIGKYGILGASFATVLSYLLIMIIASFILMQKQMLGCKAREIMVIIFTLFVLVMDMCHINSYIMIALSVFLTITICILYWKDAFIYIKKMLA